MTYPTTVQKIWLANIADDRCTIGSGDQEIARDIPLDIGRLIAAAPELLDALTNLYLVAQEQLDQSATHDGLANCDWLAAARAAINKATAQQ